MDTTRQTLRFPAQAVLPNTTFRWRTLLAGLALLLAAIFILSLVLGSVNIPIGDIVTILAGGDAAKASWKTIILNIRLPKALTAVLAGAALSVAGLQMQTLFRNPLAGPFVLGINSGASLGVALVVLSAGTTGAVVLAGLGFLADLGIAAAAILGAGMVLLLVLLVADRVSSTMTLLILGLLFGYAAGAVVSILMYFSLPQRLQAFINWTFGSFGGVSWSQMLILGPLVIAGLLIALIVAKPLNALLLGESYARSLGLSVKQARWLIILSSALLSGAVTAFCGPIGFIGVAVPHLCRSLFGTSDHRILVPGTILLGAALALIADLIAQVPGSETILPLNAVTALIGAPVVAWVILRRRNLREAFAA